MTATGSAESLCRGLGLQLFIGGVFVFIVNPAAAFGPGDFLDLPAEILAPGPILLVEQVLANQFRSKRTGQHGHAAVVDERLKVALAEFSLRIVNFLQ